MKETVIVGGARTPFGKFGGGLKDVSAADLGATAIRGALNRSGIPDEAVQEVIMGMVLQGGAGSDSFPSGAAKGRFALGSGDGDH